MSFYKEKNQNRHRKTRKATTNKNNQTKKPNKKNHTPRSWNEVSKSYAWNVVTRQPMCPVLSRSSLKQQLKAKHLKDDRGAKQKSRSAETQDPPSQDPGDRITKPCRHNKHQCTSNASICLAVWEDMRVKRKWNGSETYRVKRTQQQHLQATQSPLMCALAIIIHIPRHSIAEGQCQCTRFSLPNLVCSSQVSCATHRRTDGYLVTEKVLLQLKSDSVCHQMQ